MTTLNRWASKLAAEPGLLTSVLALLAHRSDSMEERDRLCTISFDETRLANEWTYDKAKDIIYDPKKKVQCLMLRGLCGK